jgi:hypothetical protein
MRHYFIGYFVGVLTLLPLSFLGAQTANSSQATYKTLTHDFGKIQETDGPVTYTFEFTNSSSTPFIIENISTTCGCTTPEYNKEPVLPGRSGIIRVSFDPTGRPGVFNSPIIVTSNNRRDQVRLTIQGEVIARPKTIEDLFPFDLTTNGLRAASNNLIYGYMGKGTKKFQTLEIVNNGSAPLQLGYRATEQTDTPANLYKIEFNPATLAPQGRGTVIFTYDLTGAEVYGQLSTAFLLTANGQVATRPISAYATATDDFSTLSEAEKANAPKANFSSQFYHFGTVGRNKTLTQTFRITNSGGRPLIVRRVATSSDKITYTLPQTSIAPGETITLTATLKTPARPERVSETVSLVVNDPERPMRELRLGANVE